MNRFMLSNTAVGVHVQLTKLKQDVQVAKQLDVDFSDCACSPSPKATKGYSNIIKDLQSLVLANARTETGNQK